MKPIKKKLAKLFIVIVAVCAVVGSLFAFVPMHGKTFDFYSAIASIRTSNELGGGVYAEYAIDNEPTEKQINEAVQTINKIMEDNGYANADVMNLNNKKIRVEIGYPIDSSSLADSYSLLSAVGVGKFELGSSSSKVFIEGKKHITDVVVNTYNSQIYVVLNFNEEGVAQYEELLKESSKQIYVLMGGETMTSFSSEGITASSQMPLSFTDYASAEDFAMKVKLGCMDVELNSDTVEINTTSSLLGATNLTADPYAKGYNFSAVAIAGVVAIAVLVLLGLAYMIWKNGIIGGFQALALLFDCIILAILLWAMPWIEVGFSALIAIAVGVGILFASSFILTSKIEEEYKQGKTVAASFESAYKKSQSKVLATGIVLAFIFGIVALIAGGELRVFGLITFLFAGLSMLHTLVMLPGFIRIFEAFNDGATKLYRFEKREEVSNEKE